MWRTVSFVERHEFDFSGNLLNPALQLGDVDNDNGNELVVGSVEGELNVFKGNGSAPWRKCSDLGMITCVIIGDICNVGKNNMACLTAEGWFYMFDIKADGCDTRSLDSDCDRTVMKPSFSQHLPANSKVILLADVDGDGCFEMVVGYSDRVVRMFKWQADNEEDVDRGTMEVSEKWQLAGQIGSITLNFSSDGQPELMVAQPGGTFVTLLIGRHKNQESLGSMQLREADGAENITDLIYHPLGANRAKNTSISTEMIGGIGRGNCDQPKHSTYYALCTLDGTLILVENDKIIWSLLVDHQLFTLHKLDVTGNGKDEVVCCSWDGQTYIVNHTKEVVRYSFDENVAAFTTGFYAIGNPDNSPCFVYATFNNKIYVYYNITLPRVESSNLIKEMKKNEKANELLRKLDLDLDSTKLKQLYTWLCYGKR